MKSLLGWSILLVAFLALPAVAQPFTITIPTTITSTITSTITVPLPDITIQIPLTIEETIFVVVEEEVDADVAQTASLDEEFEEEDDGGAGDADRNENGSTVCTVPTLLRIFLCPVIN